MSTDRTAQIKPVQILITPNLSIHFDGNDLYSINVMHPNSDNTNEGNQIQFEYSNAEKNISELRCTEAEKFNALKSINNFRYECMRIYHNDVLVHMTTLMSHGTIQQLQSDAVTIRVQEWSPSESQLCDNNFTIKVRNSLFNCNCNAVSEGRCTFIGHALK